MGNQFIISSGFDGININIGINNGSNTDVNLLGIGVNLFTPVAQAQEYVTGGNWASVCCGPSCEVDFCHGDGNYTCCKGTSTEAE